MPEIILTFLLTHLECTTRGCLFQKTGSVKNFFFCNIISLIFIGRWPHLWTNISPYVLLSITNLYLNAKVLFNLYIAKTHSSPLQSTSYIEYESVFIGALSVANDRNPSHTSLITRAMYWFITLIQELIIQELSQYCNLQMLLQTPFLFLFPSIFLICFPL